MDNVYYRIEDKKRRLMLFGSFDTFFKIIGLYNLIIGNAQVVHVSTYIHDWYFVYSWLLSRFAARVLMCEQVH